MMKKVYESPKAEAMLLTTSEDILTISAEEVFDFEVSFDELWNA